MKIWKKAVGILAVAGVALSLVACGSSKKESTSEDKNPSSVDAIKKRGEKGPKKHKKRPFLTFKAVQKCWIKITTLLFQGVPF